MKDTKPAKRPAVTVPPALLSEHAKRLPLAMQWKVKAAAEIVGEMSKQLRLRNERTK